MHGVFVPYLVVSYNGRGSQGEYQRSFQEEQGEAQDFTEALMPNQGGAMTLPGDKSDKFGKLINPYKTASSYKTVFYCGRRGKKDTEGACFYILSVRVPA